METSKYENGEGTIRLQLQVPSFVASGIESSRTRLQAIEEQAQEMFKDLCSRGNREIESIRDRLPVVSLRDKLPVDDFVERARTVENETRERAEALADDVEKRLQGLQDGVLALAGIASRDQVAALARDLDRLSRRLDRLARQARADKPKATGRSEQAGKATKTRASKKTSSSRGRKARG